MPVITQLKVRLMGYMPQLKPAMIAAGCQLAGCLPEPQLAATAEGYAISQP